MHFERFKTKGTNNYLNISEIRLSFVFTSTLETDRHTPLCCIKYYNSITVYSIQDLSERHNKPLTDISVLMTVVEEGAEMIGL